MATTAAGIALSGAHDAAQSLKVSAALSEVAAIWAGTIDPYNLAATAPNYLSAASASIAGHHAAAGQLSATYYDLLRDIEADPTALKTSTWKGAKAAGPLPPVLVHTSLNVTGPIAFKQGMSAGLTIQEAQAKALKSTMGATTRLVESGPRATIQQSTALDHLAKGWLRRSQGVPCSFCAMLISRGPVYRTRSSGTFRAHDFCNCKADPFFQGTGWNAQSVEYRDLWDEAEANLVAAHKAATGKLPKHGIPSSDVNREFSALYRVRNPKIKTPDTVLDEATEEAARRAAGSSASKAAEAAARAAQETADAAKDVVQAAIRIAQEAADEAAKKAAAQAAARAALEKKWLGKPAPKSPTAPVPPKNAKDKAVDEWLAAMEARYDALGTGKPFSSSYNYSYVGQAASGDSSALAHLVTNHYADDALAAMLRRALFTKADLLPEDEALYRAALRSYKNRATRHARYMDEWRDVNGVTSSLKGMDDGVRTFASNTEALQWAVQHLPKVSSAAERAAKAYTGSDYRPWNEALRRQATRESAPSDWAAKTKAVDEGMKKSLLPEDTLMYRGTNFDEFAFPDGTRTTSIPPPDPMDLVGTVQTQHGYGSVSMSGGPNARGAFGGQVQLVLRVPKDHETILATRFSKFGDSEREVLLGRSTSFYVHGVYKKDSGFVVEAEVIPFGVDPASFAGAVPMPRSFRP